MPLATAALNIMSLGAAAVGMCFGVLLPIIFPGACLGTIVTILVGFFVPSLNVSFLYPIAALIGALIGTK